MLKRINDIKVVTKPGPREGTGILDFRYLFTPQEVDNRLDMIAHITLHPGDSIGRHSHDDDAEIYYIIRGSIQWEDNGTFYEAHKGDILYTANGEFHQAKNISEHDAEMLAFILPNGKQ